MEKKYYLLIAAILLVLAIDLISYKFFTTQGKKDLKDLTDSEIEVINSAAYSFLKCISSCSITGTEGQEQFDQNCLMGCQKQQDERLKTAGINMSDLSSTDSTKNPKLILFADEIPNCQKNSKSFKEFVSCIKQALPILKQRYNIKE